MIPANYYQSEAWQNKRKKYLKKKCAWCNSADNLTLHHKNPIQTKYEIAKSITKDDFKGNFDKEMDKRLADEERVYLEAGEDDLMTLCRKCHYLWEKYRIRLCPKCKKKYIKYDEQKKCTECFIEAQKENTNGRKKEVKKRVCKVKPNKKGKWNPEIKQIHKKLGEKPAHKGRKYRVTFGVKNLGCKRKRVTVYASQLKYLTRILKKKKKIILDKTAV